MKQNIKKIVILSVISVIAVIFSRCQNDEYFLKNDDTNLASAKTWFSKYEGNGDNIELFQNLNYEWQKAEIKEGKDGTQLIVVPIVEVKKEQNEDWEQRLYIYKIDQNNYKALLYEFYPENLAYANSNDFNGYISVWDLKTGFIKAAKFVNDKIVENGDVEILSKDKLAVKNTTAKVPQESNFDDDTSYRVGETLRTVVVQNNYIDSMYYVSRRGEDFTGGGTYEDYSSVHSGGGGAGSNNNSTTVVVPPSCQSFNFIKTTSLWQVALVKNITFTIVLLDGKGAHITHRISYPQAISFGSPTNLQKGGANLTAGMVATLSARALQTSIQEVVDRYGAKNVSEMVVDQYFRDRLVYNYPLFINGGRANFNSTDNLPATDYKTTLLFLDDCDK